MNMHARDLTRTSRSSLVRALLATQVGEGRSLPEQFTTADVCAALGLRHPDGAVSGYLSRCVADGAVVQVSGERRDGCYLVVILDIGLLPAVRRAPGVGSRTGRTHRGVPHLPYLPGLEPAQTVEGSAPDLGASLAASAWSEPPLVHDPRARLQALAAELAALAAELSGPALRDVPTGDLLAELGRRAGCAKL